MQHTEYAHCLATGISCAEPQTLQNVHKGQRVRISAVHAQGALGRRLRDMGLLPGVEMTVTGRAPLGCPLSVALEGYELSLRCEEAERVWVHCLETQKSCGREQ